MARLGACTVLLLALLCASSGAGALAGPLRAAGVTRPLGPQRPSSAAASRRLLSEDSLIGGLLFSHWANNWLARRGISYGGGFNSFGGGGAGAATATATATARVDPTFSGFIGSGDATAAARAIVGGGMDMDTAAWSLLSAARGGGASASAVGSVFATTAGMSGPSFTNVFARAAAMAVEEGGDMRSGFVAATAAAFAAADARGTMGPFALAAADAMARASAAWGPQFGSEFASSFGAAMAQAVAAGNEGAVVEATATVFCSGTGAQAEAWSQAVAQSVSVDPATGCLVLQRVVARAQAMCVNGVATAMASSTATRTLLGGTCGGGLLLGGGFQGQQGLTTGRTTATATATASTTGGTNTFTSGGGFGGGLSS